jgi:hypothetical protein
MMNPFSPEWFGADFPSFVTLSHAGSRVTRKRGKGTLYETSVFWSIKLAAPSAGGQADQVKSETPEDREAKGGPDERQSVAKVPHQVNRRVQARRNGMA